MSQTVWKYDLGNKPTSDHDIPAGAKFLSAGLNPDGALCVWMQVDDEFTDLETHTFGIFVTGGPVLEGWTHCNTLRVGTLMLHIYHFDTVEPIKVSITEMDDLGDA